MKARLTKKFRWSPDGNRVETYEPGTVLEGRLAEAAISTGVGEPVPYEPKLATKETAPTNAKPRGRP